jgi:3-oxoacyl-[acyl-carrier protein] reductase
VSCAGRTGIKSHEVECEDFERVFRVNTTGTFLMCKAVLPVMLAQGEKGSGRICNIASIAGKEGNAGMVAYSASKAAVRAALCEWCCFACARVCA